MAKPKSTTPAREYEDYELDPRYAYLEFLHYERRLLQAELWPGSDPDREFVAHTFATRFHFPSKGKRAAPSTRALKMLEAAGVKYPAGTKPTRFEVQA